VQWLVYIAVFGWAFLANFVPHFVNGISGDRFTTPFAKPPGRGLSSPAVNVLWGLLNLVFRILPVSRGEDVGRRQRDPADLFRGRLSR